MDRTCLLPALNSLLPELESEYFKNGVGRDVVSGRECTIVQFVIRILIHKVSFESAD